LAELTVAAVVNASAVSDLVGLDATKVLPEIHEHNEVFVLNCYE